MFNPEWSRSLLGLGLALWLLPAQACGPNFPLRLLNDRSNTLNELPEGSFSVEINRLGQSIQGLPQAGEATISPYWDSNNEQYLDARVAVEKQQLSAEQFSLISQLRALNDVRQVEIQGAPLPTELRLYTAGAVAFAQADHDLAIEYFQRVLALPATERPLRSTWAAYSLGRLHAARSLFEGVPAGAAHDELEAKRFMQENAATARQRFQQARQLAIEGFSDPLELGIASLGEEARVDLNQDDWSSAIHLYATQFRKGSSTGYSSLRQLAWTLTSKSDAELFPLLANLEIQQLLTAQLFSQLDDYDPHGKQSRRLLGLLQRAEPIHPELADRLAALAYQQGDYAGARRLLAQAADNGLAWWLRAKLALQEGNKDAAANAYAKAAKAFPEEEDWGSRSNDNGDYETLKPRCRIGGEIAILALERGDYLDAFEQLYRSGDIYWHDAAEVAERVLSSDELKAYIDTKVVAAPLPKPGQTQYYWERPLASRTRELLGRRLLREGRYSEAVSYFASSELQAAARQYGAAREQAEDAWTAIGRAEGYYHAAKLAREQGMELLGYELGPDEAWSGGSFGSDFGKPVLAADLLTSAEARLQNATAAQPNRRYHYRYLAADLASQAADLLPARS
ncbi:MAG TPA: hypothetical protein VJA19_19605, partial [Pseudomonas sp.]|nr:hypothetical protein [Pseudomonas sp.]